jgi:glucans biosynthesis protein
VSLVPRLFLALLVLAVTASAGPTGDEFSLALLRQRARELSKQEYEKRSADDLPRWLAELDFDGYRRIQFRPQATLWSGDALPFQLRFAHRGYLYRQRMPIQLVGETGSVAEARFGPAQFEYGFPLPDVVPDDLGYSGFAVLLPGPRTGTWNEIASFLGASYFRVTGEGQLYGASARGLAIDTASASGEEFPEFVEMWVQRPRPDARELELFALLDSPSTTGAYRFVLTPGPETLVDVEAWLNPRRAIAKLGLAPLTSMFLYGEERLRSFHDFRPEVHDSDGVLVAEADGGWLWRPLVNPEGEHRVSRVPLDDPQGFGLLQRDRSFASYQDLEARYERRTSYWVTPHAGFGAGALELVEVPSDAEHNDNVVVYWTPEHAPAAGEELALHYTLSAFLDDPERSPLARVRATRVRPPDEKSDAPVLFVLDFEAAEDGAGSESGDEPGALVADVHASTGELGNVTLQPNEPAGGLRLAFELAGAGRELVELRATLRRADAAVSETWLYRWQGR